MKREKSRLDIVTEPYCNDLLAAAKRPCAGPKQLRDIDLQYGRTILIVEEEIGDITERDKQMKILRRGQLFVATSIMSMEDSYPNVAAYITQRVHEAHNSF